MSNLFDPVEIRGLRLRNRIGISPMQQYSASSDGKPTDWHLAKLLPRALGGAALVFTESTAVSAVGRFGLSDLGLWDDGQIVGHARLAKAVRQTGAVAAVQLGHAGRKAGRSLPWIGGPLSDGWPIWQDIAWFADETLVSIDTLTADLDFSSMDE